MSSVRKKDQSPHRFTVLDIALDVYDYTTTVIANPKVFDRTYKDLIDRMDREASLIYHYCRAANDDYDNRIKDKASYDVKVGDILEITFGQRTLKLRVLEVKDTVATADAAAMYEIIEE